MGSWNPQDGASGVQQANADSDLAVSGYGSAQERCRNLVMWGERLNIGIMATVLPALPS